MYHVAERFDNSTNKPKMKSKKMCACVAMLQVTHLMSETVHGSMSFMEIGKNSRLKG